MRRSSNGGSQNRLSGEAWEALYLSGHPPSSPSIHAVSKPPQQLSVSRQMMIAGAFRWQTSPSRREIRRPGDARRFCHNGRSQGSGWQMPSAAASHRFHYDSPRTWAKTRHSLVSVIMVSP